MPIKIDGKDWKDYEKQPYLQALIPRGKDKRVTFAFINDQPYNVITDHGIKAKYGGETSIATTCTTRVPINGVMQTVVVTYYKNANKRIVNGSVVEELAPDRIAFPKKRRIVDAVTELDLLFYLFVNNKCENPDAQNNTPPKFRVIKSKDTAAPRVKSVNERVKAVQAVNDLKERSTYKLRQLYQFCGFTDWDDLVGSRLAESERDWDTVMDRLYLRAERRPAEILAAIDDALLDVASKVTMALAHKVIEYSEGKFAWGENCGNDELKGVLIRKVPKSHQVTGEAANAWFTEWLKTDKEGILEGQQLTSMLTAFEKAGVAA